MQMRPRFQLEQKNAVFARFCLVRFSLAPFIATVNSFMKFVLMFRVWPQPHVSILLMTAYHRLLSFWTWALNYSDYSLNGVLQKLVVTHLVNKSPGLQGTEVSLLLFSQEAISDPRPELDDPVHIPLLISLISFLTLPFHFRLGPQSCLFP